MVEYLKKECLEGDTCRETVSDLAGCLTQRQFVENVINAMDDWVRVIDCDDNILFMNKSMRNALGLPIIQDSLFFETNEINEITEITEITDQSVDNLSHTEISHQNVIIKDVHAMKCYEAIGRDTPCELCTSRKAVFSGEVQEKEEIIRGRTYSVKSSPVRNNKGEIFSIVEVLRDVTEVRKMQKKIFSQNDRMKNELDIARKLQGCLLPQADAASLSDCCNFSFVYEPCSALGGDFVDLFRIDNDHIGCYIADVAGHGIPAALLTIFLKTALNRTLLSPAEALETLYKDYNMSCFDNDIYITIFYSIFNLKDKIMTYANAGHNISPVRYGKNDFKFLQSPGIPISNWVPDPLYTDTVMQFDSGDRFFYATDGIIELRNGRGEVFGEDDVLRILQDFSGTPSETLKSINIKVLEFLGEQDFTNIQDDITMAIIELI